MSTLAIEINDAGLTVANAGGIVVVEPGYAIVEDGRIETGIAAYGEARIKPRKVSNRFWSNLSVEPGSAGLEGVGSSAELAFLQLEAVWRTHGAGADDVVLIVPAWYGQEQLGLLLGLAQECEMNVLAMVDAAVAASSRPYPGRQLVYADASLHRVSVTALEQSDEVSARSERGLETIGLAALNDLLAKRLAEIFVLATRFDPFHEAASEQRLYDRLPEWLDLVHEHETAEISLPYRDEAFGVEVARGQLLSVAAGFYQALRQVVAQTREGPGGLVVQLTDRLAKLPGLIDELARLDDALVVTLAPGHAATAVLASLDALRAQPGQVRLIRHLGWREAPAEPAPRAAEAPAPQPSHARGRAPTHVVYRGLAYAVAPGGDGAGLLIGRSKTEGRRMIVVDDQRGGVSRSHCEIRVRDGELVLRDLSSYGTFVNERRVSGEEQLKPADVIRIGSPGAELQVVAVEAGHGA